MAELMENAQGYAAISLPFLIVFTVFFFTYMSSRSKHKMLTKIAEQTGDKAELKALLVQLEKPKRETNYRRDGIITAFVGVGLYLFGKVSLGSTVEGVGLLVGAIGCGMLIGGLLFPGRRPEA
ncbi:MAG: DUF6249 domain-containing protein [Henriciella sp.]